MSQLVIVADSAADLPHSIRDELGIIVVPLYVNWSGNTYKDGVDLVPADFYPRLKQEDKLPTTSQPTPGTYLELFNELLAEGKDILCLTLSSGLSGTYSSAITAKGMLDDQERVEVLDTMAASIGEGMLILEAVRLAKQGLGLKEIIPPLKDKISRLCSIFTINTLENLVKGGRLSLIQGGLGALLDIKPILHLDTQGKIVPLTKVRSRKKALAKLEEELQKQGKDLQGQIMGVSHAHDPKLGAEMAKKIGRASCR